MEKIVRLGIIWVSAKLKQCDWHVALWVSFVSIWFYFHINEATSGKNQLLDIQMEEYAYIILCLFYIICLNFK